MKRHCLLILTGCLLLPFVVQCEGGVNPLDQAKLPAVGGETEESAGTASCPAGSRLLPKDADIVLSLSPARAYKAEPFKFSIGEDIKKWEEEVRKEVGTFPYKDIMTDVSMIHAAFVLKGAAGKAADASAKPMDVPVGGKFIDFAKLKALQKVEPPKPVRPAVNDPFEAFEDYGFVIEGNLDPKFDLGDVLGKAKVEAGFSVVEVQADVYEITAPAGGQEYLVGIVDGKFVFGTEGFVEGVIDASKANKDECPLKEALGTLPPEAVLKMAFDLTDWPELELKEKAKEAFAVAPEVWQGVFALDFKDRLIVALNLYTSKNWAEPFGELLLQFAYKDLEEEIQKDLFKDFFKKAVERIQGSKSSSALSSSREKCVSLFAEIQAKLKDKLATCVAAAGNEEEKMRCTDDYEAELKKTGEERAECMKLR